MNVISKKIIAGLLFISIISLFVPNFLLFKKTRLRTSISLSAKESLGAFLFVILVITIIMFILLWIEWSYNIYIIMMLSSINIIVLIYSTANALSWLLLDKTEYSRLSFGPVSWLWMTCMFLVCIKASENVKNKGYPLFLGVIVVILIVSLLLSHSLDGLSVLKEYQSSKNMYWKNMESHIWISAIVMLVSIAIGVPLGYLVNKNKYLDRIVFGVINITETIPGISFIAFLMIPFTYLSTNFPGLRDYGIKAFGPGPACIALIFYAIFPIIHNTRAAFKSIDELYIEVAQAMGMERKKIFFQIMIPMAFPTVLNGVRIALVYTISGVTLAAFIGGGGLGYYMLKSESMDTVLLGLIPVIIMTFIVDKGMRFVTSLLPFGGVMINND